MFSLLSLTESCCTGTVMENSDMSTGTVGRPMTGLEVKLVDWEEGSYRTSDKPRPRGNYKVFELICYCIYMLN